MKLEAIQQFLAQEQMDGWLFFDHHRRDPLAYRVLGLPPERVATRRWYYLIPAHGEPRGLVHRIESFVLDGLAGEIEKYASWQEQVDGVHRLLQGRHRIAMQYSPQCAIPYVSMVDAGTMELVRAAGVEVVSSANLIQYFEARWNAANLELHLEAGRKVDEARRNAFQFVSEKLRTGQCPGEFEVQQFLLAEFARAGLVTDHGPIVAVNENASNPHYEPTASTSREIRPGDLLLIDMWAKVNAPEGVYYDITWTGYCGPNAPEQMRKVFAVVRDARDKAIACVQRAVVEGRDLRGFEVDDAARRYIEERGFGEYFIHRTGHSIGTEVHSNGANMDDLEIHDERRILPNSLFSIEPGIYLAEFGVRSEVNVLVRPGSAEVTGKIQREIVTI